MIYQGFIGTNDSKEANGNNVGPLKHARESIKRLGEHKQQDSGKNGSRNGVGRVEHIDATFLHHDVPDKPAAQTTQKTKTHKAHKV